MLKNNGVRMSYSFYKSDKMSLLEKLKQLNIEILQEEGVVIYKLLILGLESGQED